MPELSTLLYGAVQQYLRRIAHGIDAAIHATADPGSARKQRVHTVQLVRATDFYGFHAEEQLFMKVIMCADSFYWASAKLPVESLACAELRTRTPETSAMTMICSARQRILCQRLQCKGSCPVFYFALFMSTLREVFHPDIQSVHAGTIQWMLVKPQSYYRSAYTPYHVLRHQSASAQAADTWQC